MLHAPYIYVYGEIARLRTLLASGDADWLTPEERLAVARLHEPSRRDAWLAGRLLAKRLVVEALGRGGLSRTGDARAGRGRECGSRTLGDRPLLGISAGEFRAVEVLSAGARPRASVAGRRLHWSLSIAHTRRGVLAALACRAGVSLGVDLVEPALCSPGFADAWFTPGERRWVSTGRSCGAVVIWGIKEAVYKAVNRGEPFQPRSFETFAGRRGDYACRFGRDGRFRFCRAAVWRTPQREIAVFAWKRFLGDTESRPSFDAHWFPSSHAISLMEATHD